MNAIAAVAARLEMHRPRTGRQLVAIDGIGGSGKTLFTAALAEEITSRAVVVLRVDDFFNPSEVQHARGRHSPEGFWLDTYDYDSLIGDALEPLSASHRHYRAALAASPSVAAEDALALVEGTFLLRDRRTAKGESSACSSTGVMSGPCRNLGPTSLRWSPPTTATPPS